MADFSMSFSPASLATIARMAGFGVYLSDEVKVALAGVSEMLAARAIANTWLVFANPTGALASTISADTTSPYEAQVTATSPYAWRRELGFSGRTDSLGRTFLHDPGKPYMAPALASIESEGNAMGLVTDAVNRALGRVAF